MATIVSCVNLKGGVGKTAIAVNFAAYCGAHGKRVLLVDLDPQTNATFSCLTVEEWREHSAHHGTIADLLGARRSTNAEGRATDPSDVVRDAVFPGVDLIPSHLDLFTVDLDLASTTARETKLRRAFRDILDDYDLVVCDCPPNLTIPTQNALALSSHYVVPVSPDYLSGLGVALLVRRVQEFASDLELPIEHAGIVISRVGRPAEHRDQVMASLRQEFGELVLGTQITERVAVSEAASRQMPIYDSGNADASAEFSAVSREILARVGLE